MQTKILNLLYGNEEVVAEEGLDIKLTLGPFNNYLEERVQDSGKIKSAFIESVLAQIKKYPGLNEGLTLPKLMEHRELLDMIYAALSVSVEDEKRLHLRRRKARRIDRKLPGVGRLSSWPTNVSLRPT